VIGCKPINAK
jgi:hypothetical protein